jgi:DNA-binding MarR family transcriptional regulator
MTFNPITALSEQIQKLITEHGSAAILRDHLALIKDQAALLEKKAAELMTENATLAAKIGVLQTKIEESEANAQLLKDRNEQLAKQIDVYNKPTEKCAPNNLLDEVKANILTLLFKHDNLRTEDIAEQLNYETQTTQFHLEELKSKNMIRDHFDRSGSFTVSLKRRSIPPHNEFIITWSLCQEGRRYVIENFLTR